MKEVDDNLKERPLLFEQESQVNAKRKAERRYEEILRQAGVEGKLLQTALEDYESGDGGNVEQLSDDGDIGDDGDIRDDGDVSDNGDGSYIGTEVHVNENSEEEEDSDNEGENEEEDDNEEDDVSDPDEDDED